MADQAAVQRLMFWDEPRPTLKDLLDLSTDQLATLAQFVDRCGFEADLSETFDLATKLGLPHERSVDLLRYMQLLNDQRIHFGLRAEEVLEEFRTYVRRKELKQSEAKLPSIAPALARLFTDSPEASLRAKKKAIAAGIVAAATGFDSLCDLRPVFDEERGKIVAYVPLALVRVRTRRDTSREPSEVVFQIDAAGLDQMEKFMALLREKFRIMESSCRHIDEEIEQ
jgi:hypothetical protein